MGKLYTIPPSVSFLDALAQGVLEQHAQTPEQLAKATILLPNRRAVRALQQAFLRISDGQAIILPRMHAVGDVGEYETSLSLFGAGVEDTPPPIPSMQRQLLLAEEIIRWQRKTGEENTLDFDSAVQLAGDLAQFLDEVQREQLPHENLTQIIPEELAEHWQVTLDFFALIFKHWPEKLKELGFSDTIEYQNTLLKQQAEYWCSHPPKHPLIAAGTTGSVPATAELLQAVFHSEQGHVILPGLDTGMDIASWDALEEHHPQYGMKLLVEQTLEQKRNNVALWSYGVENVVSRDAFVRELMRPTSTIRHWQEKGKFPASSTENITLLELQDLNEEALAIAMMLRRVLEAPVKTACLVTAERGLSRRVAAILERWDITVDDSSGVPITKLPSIVFLKLLAQAVAARFAPVSLLALLKHPFTAVGLSVGECKAHARALEKAALRGIRPEGGLEALQEAVKDNVALSTWLGSLEKTCAPLVILLEAQNASLSEILQTHIAVAANLATTEEEAGTERLWQGDKGQQAYVALEKMVEATAAALQPIDTQSYGGVFDALCTGETYRPKYDTHPRLAIQSPIEARLQQYNCVILGGVNEGSWPAEHASPWMSKPMRESFGLPSSKRVMGLAAHDFTALLQCPEVYITRAAKVDGTPTVTSPWLLRLEALMESEKIEINRSDACLEWLTLLDTPDKIVPLSAPSPTPPLAARPDTLWATHVGKLVKDPYTIYASRILELRPLEPIDKDPGAAEFGNVLHKILELYVKEYQESSLAEQCERLRTIGKRMLAEEAVRPAMVALWWPKFDAMVLWFCSEEQKRRASLKSVHTELKGEVVLEIEGQKITLKAYADRIEETLDETLTIMDYKTGTLASKLSIEQGIEPQLPVEGVIASAGGFAGLSHTNVTSLALWKVIGSEQSRKVTEVAFDKEAAMTGLAKILRILADESLPFLASPHSERELRYNHYEHLERLAEWGNDKFN
jgi:ATP-dependent helicase/nuclease subunit B